MALSGGGESLLAAAFGGGLLLAAADDGRVKRHECRTGDRRTDGMSIYVELGAIASNF